MNSEAVYVALGTFANLKTSSIYDITQAIPGAASLFLSFGIDPYVNRHAPLPGCIFEDRRDAAILARLRSLVRAIEKAAAEPDILISYLLTHFHDTHREGISELVRMANSMEARHAAHPYSPHGLALLLDRLDALVTAHMENEEELLFAVMSRRISLPSARRLAELSLEHGEQEKMLSCVERLTGMFRAPDDAPEIWRLLYARLRHLHVTFKDHNRLEEEVLFPCFMVGKVH